MEFTVTETRLKNADTIITLQCRELNQWSSAMHENFYVG